jgi:ABC-type nitrate/sulfonate/bicarbonate transport system substrate-binding protein
MWLLAAAQPALALEEILISYAGPSITFLPAEVARQRGFFREQNLDVKLLLTRTEVDRAALASVNIDYTLRAGSTFVSAARGLPVRGENCFPRHDETVLGAGGAPGS